MQTCPKCSLLNPDAASMCDCGHAFGGVLIALRLLKKRHDSKAAQRRKTG